MTRELRVIAQLINGIQQRQVAGLTARNNGSNNLDVWPWPGDMSDDVLHQDTSGMRDGLCRSGGQKALLSVDEADLRLHDRHAFESRNEFVHN